jgi:hypothetical protein
MNHYLNLALATDTYILHEHMRLYGCLNPNKNNLDELIKSATLIHFVGGYTETKLQLQDFCLCQ